MQLNFHRLGRSVLNGLGFSQAAAPVEVYADAQKRPYRLEAHSKDGELLLCLPMAYGGKWERALNKPATLQAGYPADDAEVVAALQFPNEIWLFEGDSVTASGKFRIIRVSIEESDGAWIEVECQDYAAQLGLETVTGYATPVDAETGDSIGATVGTVLQAILDMQTFTPRVTRGTIHASIRNKVYHGRFDGRSVLQCLADLQEFAGGYWWVDGAHRLQWKPTVGNDEGHRLRLGHNTAGVKTTIDYSELATRVIARGEGTTADTVLTVTKNNLDAQETYGIITAHLNDQSIHDATVLDAVATAELERRSQPKAYFDLGVIDLSKTDVYDYSFEARALLPGTVVNVISGYFDQYLRVDRVEIDLDEPLAVKVELGSKAAGTGARARSTTSKDREDLASIIAALAERIDDLANDRGEVESLRRSLDPVPVGLDAVATWDEARDTGNLPEKIDDLLSIPYGDLTDVDAAKDALIATINDAIENDRGGIVETLNATIEFQLIERDDRDELNAAMADGDLGRTTGDNKAVYAKIDTLEKPLMVIEAADVAELDTILKARELGTTLDDDALYWRTTTARVRLDGLS